MAADQAHSWASRLLQPGLRLLYSSLALSRNTAICSALPSRRHRLVASAAVSRGEILRGIEHCDGTVRAIPHPLAVHLIGCLRIGLCVALRACLVPCSLAVSPLGSRGNRCGRWGIGLRQSRGLDCWGGAACSCIETMPRESAGSWELCLWLCSFLSHWVLPPVAVSYHRNQPPRNTP